MTAMHRARRRIVDAHHHLWDLDACRYPWLLAKGVPRFFGDPAPIQRNYLVADFLHDSRDYEIDASVHVQVGVAPGAELDETRWLQDTADRSGLPSAIVAFCDLASDDAESMLRAQCTFPAVRGIRQIVGRSAEEDARTGSGDVLYDATWIRNLGLLPEMKLSFDLQLVPAQMQRAAELLSGLPDLQVALCHCGSPQDRSPQGLRIWTEGLEKLAALPNLYCKLSGLGMFEHHWTTESIRPFVETCIDRFGASRCMVGSNFPVDKLHASYTRTLQAYEQIAASLSSAERAALFAGTARRFYRL